MVKAPSKRPARKVRRAHRGAAVIAPVAGPAATAAVSGAAASAAAPAPTPSASAAPAEPTQRPATNDKKSPGDVGQIRAVDIEAFARNAARLIEEGGKAMAAYLKPREEGQIRSEMPDEVAEVVKTLGQVLEYWLSDPQRAFEFQSGLARDYLELWAATAKRMAGQEAPPVAQADARDRRFADPEWSSNHFFDFLKLASLLTVRGADPPVHDAEGIDPHTRHKAEFYMRQIANAISPSNFVLTNPELLRTTLSSNAENLVRGMHMLAEDIQAGRGTLKIRQSDRTLFQVGKNLAATPGKVIFQNDLMQLIQYAPTTETVLKVPVLIVPPWINKFYILDLTPEKSFIKWCVDQGVTVFVISWVNPDARLARKGFEDYMREGPLQALDVIAQATRETKVHNIGSCIGGTLLAVTLAHLAASGEDRVVSATLFAAQVDFTYAGDLKVFVDEEQIQALERRMEEQGYLEGSHMAGAFNMLYWNSDSTRMPAANHSFYLRNCYLKNSLSKGEMIIAGRPIDLGKVTVPIYNLATREDHIAPAKSAFLGSKFFGGPVRFVLAGSGHIAGVVNPPAKAKYQYWTGGAAIDSLDSWLAQAQEHPGSWWPDWLQWIKEFDSTEAAARTPGGGRFNAVEDAPGSYVKMQA